MATVEPRRCSIADALGIVGDRWSLLVLRELGFGSDRFTQIARATGAPRAVLTERLRKLEAAGVISRDEAAPGRVRYALTAAGEDLGGVLLALREWGDQHVNPDDPPIITTHTCGHVFHPQVHCRACGQPVAAADLRHSETTAPDR
jgi:DNA-binding HxlR family transcriptional regulator